MLVFKAGAAIIALSSGGLASAQHAGHMPGMTMPMPAPAPAKKKPAAKKAAPTSAKPAAKKPAAAKPAARKPAAPATTVDDSQLSQPTAATPIVDHSQMDMSVPPPAAQIVDHGQMDMGDGAMPGMDHSAGGHQAMRGAFGGYPMNREASGTAWQPDSSDHGGYMRQSGEWTLMAHGNLDFVADTQGGRRGADKLFAAGMLMAMARRDFADGNSLQLKAMVSPDPLMGKRGYPLLLASGETADGETRLIDRQHPHDLFMELSASYSVRLGASNSAFLYAGLPGEPAFGPPAFMHRQSISVSPEAPITHHWLDSTHISFGVVTAGLVLGRVKFEASRFNGREPDQHRYDIEPGKLDSTALRVSWNPTDELSLQGSWAHLTDPEQLEPGVDQKRWSASGIYTRRLADGWWSTTLAWGRKRSRNDDGDGGHAQDAFALESSVKRDAWTLFGRGEIAENNELVRGLDDGRAYRVGKTSVGAARDLDLTGPLDLQVGVLSSVNFIPRSLSGDYGGKHPLGAMGFVRLQLD